MKKFTFLSLLLILVVLISSACTDLQPEPTPTATLLPPTQTATRTPVPSTATPEPTPTSKPTGTPAQGTILELGEVVELPTGGFSYQPIIGYDIESDSGPGTAGLGVFDPQGTIMIALNGVTTYNGDQTREEIMDEFISAFENQGIGTYEKSESYPITVGSVEGVAVDLAGTTFERPIEGQAFVVMFSKNQFLFGLGMAIVREDMNHWLDEGRQVFSTLVETIIFLEVEQETGSNDPDGSVCVVSTDARYGYSKDDPIRVGGDWLDGPPREEAYLDSLCGPNGEAVSYVRRGSEPHGETILDAYEVSHEGAAPVILYLDEYSYAELMAPVGFKCWTAFPLTAPE